MLSESKQELQIVLMVYILVCLGDEMNKVSIWDAIALAIKNRCSGLIFQ